MPITPYTGTFAKPQLIHLLRRTMIGLTKPDITYFTGMTMVQVITELLTPAPVPAPPVNDYSSLDPAAALGATWVNTASGNFTSERRNSLRAWWVGNLIQQNRSITEKMILFWHNHVPTEYGSIDAYLFYRYLELLRTYALGNFKTMIREVSIDGSMLFYLNGYLNKNTAPDENYARELQELFTIGKDLPSYYTQDDVIAASKVLTGWKVTTSNPAAPVSFNSAHHDTSNKTFSAFYNNTVIMGQTGTGGGLIELNALMDMIFAHDEVARHIVRKLYRFFVYYDITPTVESDIIMPLANTFRTNNYEILPVLTELFSSAHFYDMMQNSSHIKNPIDSLVGVIRTFGFNYTPGNDAVNYLSWRTIHNRCGSQGMMIGDPPSVAGWTAYYQSPGYYRQWIYATSLRAHKTHMDSVTSGGFGGVAANILAFTATMNNPSDPDLLIEEVLELLHGLPSEPALKTQLKSLLLSGQTQNSYWTTAWNNYVGDPTNTTHVNTATSRLRNFYRAVLTMAEAHLC
ncbi:MAG: DUF1800 family protein [Bacteroidia bacterium]